MLIKRLRCRRPGHQFRAVRVRAGDDRSQRVERDCSDVDRTIRTVKRTRMTVKSVVSRVVEDVDRSKRTAGVQLGEEGADLSIGGTDRGTRPGTADVGDSARAEVGRKEL